MIGLLPAEVDSIDREARIARVRIPGLTDGATELPEAEFCNPIGDKSEHTEIRVLPGDRVWLAFVGGDTRYPVIVGYRPRNEANNMNWRRFEHDNIELDADKQIRLKAGNRTHIASPNVLIEASATKVTGSLSVGTGASGSFTTPTGTVVVVEDGIVVNIF